MKGKKERGKTVRHWSARLCLLAMVLPLLLAALACSAPTTLQQDYGRSVSNNIAQQVVHPEAGRDLTPAVGLDPKAAVGALDKYDKSFKAEEKKTEFKMLTQY